MCGFEADESVLTLSGAGESTDIFGGKEGVIEMPLSGFEVEAGESGQSKNNKEGQEMDKKHNESDNEIFFKEIDSWKITFSKKDQCICLATPALKSFKIKLTVDDLKELLDFISEKAHIDMKAKQRFVTGHEISELVEILDKMIEVKKAKFKVKFSVDELQGIADIINKQLKD